jgi:hypothetical protein
MKAGKGITRYCGKGLVAGYAFFVTTGFALLQNTG